MLAESPDVTTIGACACAAAALRQEGFTNWVSEMASLPGLVIGEGLQPEGLDFLDRCSFDFMDQNTEGLGRALNQSNPIVALHGTRVEQFAWLAHGRP